MTVIISGRMWLTSSVTHSIVLIVSLFFLLCPPTLGIIVTHSIIIHGVLGVAMGVFISCSTSSIHEHRISIDNGRGVGSRRAIHHGGRVVARIVVSVGSPLILVGIVALVVILWSLVHPHSSLMIIIHVGVVLPAVFTAVAAFLPSSIVHPFRVAVIVVHAIISILVVLLSPIIAGEGGH